jgi:hypothetical protein
VLADTSWILGNVSAITGEAIALLEVIHGSRGFRNFIFETDSKNVADAVHYSRSGVSEFSSLISKIKCLLSFHLRFKVKFVKRETNMVDHTLYKEVTPRFAIYLNN